MSDTKRIFLTFVQEFSSGINQLTSYLTEVIYNDIIPYSNYLLKKSLNEYDKILYTQRKYTFLTNLIFFILLILSIYIIRTIYLFIYDITVGKFKRYLSNRDHYKYLDIATKLRGDVEKYLTHSNKSQKYKPVFEFKAEPQKLEDLLKEINRARDKDQGNSVNIKKLSGKVFKSDDKELKSISYQVGKVYSYSNLLHPDVFHSTRHIESEVIKMMLGFFGGNDIDNCGVTTLCNTESLTLVFLAIKNMSGLKDKVSIAIAETCPSVYFKVAHMLNINLVLLPVQTNGSLDLNKSIPLMKKSQAIVGLYPCNSTGIEDDIEGLSEFCLKEKKHLHVDASYGGFMAAFSRDSTLFKKFDFRLKGVSSLHVDISSFAKAPTGVGFVGYRSREIRKNHYFSFGKWMGGVYASPTLPGSRCGMNIVATYVTFLNLGLGSFKGMSKLQYDAIKTLVNDILKNKDLKDLEIIGNPNFNVISIVSKDTFPLVSVYESMKMKEWDLQFRFKSNKNGLLSKDSIILTITGNNMDTVKDEFIQDLVKSVKDVKDNHNAIIESDATKTLRKISALPHFYQSIALGLHGLSKTEFK